MSEEEDLELLALQRQLDDAFQTTRPRPAFEDELWLRMQSRRPIWRRLQDALAALFEGVKEAPAVPSAAVAVVLIVLVGAGILTLSGLHPGGGAGSTAATHAGTGKFAPNTAPEFGPVQAPALSGSAASPGAPTAGIDGSAFVYPNNIYFGSANLSWGGQLNVTATSLPVFRYQEPATADADRFAASVGASSPRQVAPSGLGMYSGKLFTLVVIGTVAQPPREPSFNLSELNSASANSGSDPVAVATAYLDARHLIPTWPYVTELQKTSTTVRVRFLRSFDLPGQGQAALVDSLGDRYGIEVDLVAGAPGAFETGPLPLDLASAGYPIINADQAVRFALASSVSSATAPAVRLSKAELVYALVSAGDYSFYEPAFLFSGTFTDHGTTYVKRVLVPAVDPSLLTH
jgi:hypothetical protein